MKFIFFAFQLTIMCSGLLSCENRSKLDKTDLSTAETSQLIDSSKLDPPLDESLMAFLDSMPQSTDTSYLHTTLVKRGTTFDAYIYEDIRNAHGGEGVIGEGFIAKFYKQILPFSESEKLYYDLITNLSKQAFYLLNRSNFMYADSGLNKPAQNGLGYSWGSKEFLIRQKPVDTCTNSIHGLDCSGFLYQLFKRNGIFLPVGRADDQRKVTTLRRALEPYFKSPFNHNIEDLGALEIKEIMSGDIMYFKNKSGEVSHIGICLENSSGVLLLFECRGSPNQCQKNISLQRGVLATVLDERLKNESREYSIVRIFMNSR